MDTDPSEDTLLARWLAGELDDAELKNLQSHPSFAEWERIAKLSGELKPPSFDAEKSWEQFSEMKEDPRDEQEEEKGFEENPEEAKIFDFKKVWIPVSTFLVAASIALILVFLPKGGVEEYSTQPGETLTLTLPGLSEVSLDPDSRLSFNKKTWADSREVSLQGAAYFKVKKGSKFTVKTSSGSVEVLGTQFQVRDRKEEYGVWCVSGKVGVSFSEEAEQVILTPNQSVRKTTGETPIPILLL